MDGGDESARLMGWRERETGKGEGVSTRGRRVSEGECERGEGISTRGGGVVSSGEGSTIRGRGEGGGRPRRAQASPKSSSLTFIFLTGKIEKHGKNRINVFEIHFFLDESLEFFLR